MLKVAATCFTILGLVPQGDGFRPVSEKSCREGWGDPAGIKRLVAEKKTWLDDAEALLKTKLPCQPKPDQKFVNEDGDRAIEVWACKTPKGSVEIVFAFVLQGEGHWSIYGPFLPLEKLNESPRAAPSGPEL